MIDPNFTVAAESRAEAIRTKNNVIRHIAILLASKGEDSVIEQLDDTLEENGHLRSGQCSSGSVSSR
jgi:hypothetical protein